MKHNPYNQVDWNAWEQVKSASHMHVLTQDNFDETVSLGYKHIASTRYSPVSAPIYPLDSRFTNIPHDVLGAPSSEKFRLTGAGGHYITLGSFLEGYGYETAVEDSIPWRQMFDEALAELQFENGGGVVIAHPQGVVPLHKEMLDHDERVLGIEIYHNGMERDQYIGYSRDRYQLMWDEILSSGRRCFGFGVVDWMIERRRPFYGSNILLVPAFTEHDCLRAYRNGEFYAIANDTGLRFSHLQGDEQEINVEINREATIRFISERGIEKEVIGYSSNFTNLQDRTFVRVEVEEEGLDDSLLFSQPFMFKDKDDLINDGNEALERMRAKKKMRRMVILR